MDATCTQAAGAYQRHQPEGSLLYSVLAENLETFLQDTRTQEHALPARVEGELRAYLECGVPAYGFVRLRCVDCGESRIAAFSCKRRGFCPSCMGRRMADTAARLADQVFPMVPVRQWVLSFPIEIRYRLAHDGALLTRVLRTFMQHLDAFYRDQARALGHADGRCGGVTFVQRFGSALNLNPHLHVLMLDGVYVPDPMSDRPTFALKRSWDDGTTHIVLSSHELIEKLAALVPPPRAHLIRYHGVLAPHAADRAQIVPAPTQPDTTPAGAPASTTKPHPRRLAWVVLLARVFAIDVSICPRCGGPMRLIAALTDPDSIRTYLSGVGLPAEPPAIAPARPPPQRELDLVA